MNGRFFVFCVLWFDFKKSSYYFCEPVIPMFYAMIFLDRIF